MAVVYDDERVRSYVDDALKAAPENPVLIDRYLENAIEVDVDCLADASGGVVVAGIMRHIEKAGIHSGDSSCVLPALGLDDSVKDQMRTIATRFARGLGVVGLMNVQFAIHEGIVYTLEVNPRASRTVPFVSKAIGVPIAKHAARLMCGETLEQLDFTTEPVPKMVSVKKVVLPFRKLVGSDPTLGPEMKSTGEVMGIASTFGQAFAKATMAAGETVPVSGTVFLSLADVDKDALMSIARELVDLKFHLIATRGTAAALEAAGVPCRAVYKVNEGRPNIVDYVKNAEIDLIINTPLGSASRYDERSIRMAALEFNIPCITTPAAAEAAVAGIRALSEQAIEVRSVQDWYLVDSER